MRWHHAILNCSQSRELEHRLLGDDPQKVDAAMKRAGRGLAQQLSQDLGVRLQIDKCHCLLLLGKGHNAGDAMIAGLSLLERHANLKITAVPVLGADQLKGTVAVHWKELCSHARVRTSSLDDLLNRDGKLRFDLSIDGIFGMQFRAPFSDELGDAIRRLNARDLGVRIAVDLPSGMSDAPSSLVLRADFTYATGILKSPLIESGNLKHAGRLRYVDIGFFDDLEEASELRVVAPALMHSLAALRPVDCDKRSFGHLLVVAGSRRMPGALCMCVRAALRSGVGLVTVLAPESLIHPCAVQMPEAMWIPWPETPEGDLALEGVGMLESLRDRITGVVMGPGCGRSQETQALLDEVVDRFEVPLVMDADALSRERMQRLQARSASLVLTPHEGEFRRIAALEKSGNVNAEQLRDFAAKFPNVVVVLKGPVTRLCANGEIVHFPWGNPILARGGSGDILAGLVGGKVAMPGKVALSIRVAQAVACHAIAADRLFAQKEETHVCTTDILNLLNSY
ncbi:MAG: NAD(P)H-hydrate dehydratase [Puniceicoccaceae bacterium]